MMQSLAVEAVSYTSLAKPLIALAVVVGWAKFATIIDKDALYFHQNRRLWNLVQVAAAVVAFTALFFIPMFFVGLLVAVIVLIAAGAGYAIVRNKTVQEDQRWHLDTEFFSRFLKARQEKQAAKKASIRFKPAKNARPTLKPVPMPDDAEYGPHMLFEDIADAALRRHAQAIHIVGAENQFLVTVSVDGVEHKQGKLGSSQAMSLIDYLKAMCGLDVEDRRKRQVGKCKIETVDVGNHELKVSTSGSTRGIKCGVLIDATKQLSIPFKDLGLLESQKQQFEPVMEAARGLVIVSCPAEQGRTTTLYALTERHDPYTMDIHTLESEVERELEGIHQNQMDPAEVPQKLASLLLRDPQVVTVANLGDPETAKTLAKAATQEQGPRVYAGLRADDAITALRIFIKAVGDQNLVAEGIYASINQRLVRKLCTVCRQKYKPDAEALRKLNLPADKAVAFYKAGGQVAVKNKMETCPACNGVGYLGRTAAFEVLVFDDEARNLVRAGKLDQLKAHLRRNKSLWLQEAAVAKVASGETSIGEVTRALATEKEG